MKRVLLVEPDHALLDTMRKYFSQRNLTVSTASTAQQAIIRADSARPDVVVLELAMPEHNGLAFLQEFRSYTDWVNVPVVIYSHIPLEDTGFTEEDWKKQGVVTYLYKSTGTLANLFNHIDQILRNYEAV